jgi:MFS family permease
VVIFVFIGNLLIKPFTTRLFRRLGFRTVLLTTNSLAGLTTAACALISGSTPLVLTAVLLVAGGAFRSIGFTGYNTVAFADVDGPAMTHASTLATTVQQLASGLGVAAGAIGLRIGVAAQGHSSASPSDHPAYQIGFLLIAALVLPAILEAWTLPRSAGAQIGGGARAGGTTIR